MSDGLDGSEVYTICEDFTWRDVNDEVVVLNVKSGEYFTFNDVGRFVWKAISSGKNVDESVRMVVDEYDVEPEKAASEIRDFIRNIVAQKMLKKT